MEKLVEEILRKGEERKQEILQQGERERDEQILKADKQIEESRLKAEKRSTAAIAQLEQQELSSAELEAKKSALAAQRQVLEELKAEILADLTSYPSDKRQRIYTKLIAKARRELGDCYVYSNPTDKAILKLPSGMVDGGTLDCRGGLVFESKDRTVRLDFRFETILEDVWNREMQEIFTKLFG